MPAPRIVSRPGLCGGDAFVLGTRVTVWLVVQLRRRGATDAEVLARHPDLDPDDLDAAWAHFRAHPVEIEQALWRNTLPAGPPEAWRIVAGLLLGLPESAVAAAFVPPLGAAAVAAAWDAYRADPARLDAQKRAACENVADGGRPC